MGTTNGKVPGRVKYTFAFGALGKDLIYGMMATFAMIYFTDVLKVSPGFVGIVFFVAKLWDAFNDLFMGMIVDNTRSRFGKFVPWLVIGTLVNSVVFVVLFTDFKLTGTSLCIFVAVIYVLWGMTYTIMDIPYWSVIPNLTSDPHEREVVSVCKYWTVISHRRIRCSDHCSLRWRIYRISSFCYDHCRNIYSYDRSCSLQLKSKRKQCTK